MKNTANGAQEAQQNILEHEFKLGGKGCIAMMDALTVEPEPLDVVFDGVLAGSVGMIVAAGATGKGYLALSMLADLATGRNTLGLDIPELKDDQGVVRLITLEDAVNPLLTRIYELGKQFDDGDKIKIAKRVHVESKTGQMYHLVDNMGKVNEKLLVEMAVAFEGSRLIILDTLRRFHAGNENDSAHMSGLISCFEVIAEHTGAAVIFLHHVNKEAALNGSSSQTSSRGASAITDNVRAQFNLTKMTEEEAEQYGVSEMERYKYVSLLNTKTNYTESKPKTWLKRGLGGVLSACQLTANISFGGKRNGARK